MKYRQGSLLETQPSDFVAQKPKETAPYAKTSETSKAAAASIEPQIGRLQSLVLEHIRNAGDVGATDQEIQDALGITVSTQIPRRHELVSKGLIAKGTTIIGNATVTKKRPTKSGRSAQVWVAI